MFALDEKQKKTIRIRWQSGCTLWAHFNSENGAPVADTENVNRNARSSELGRSRADDLQDQSPSSVMLENLLIPGA